MDEAKLKDAFLSFRKQGKSGRRPRVLERNRTQHPETSTTHQAVDKHLPFHKRDCRAYANFGGRSFDYSTSKAGSQHSYRELAMCEVDSDPNIYVGNAQGNSWARLSRRCIYDIGRAMTLQ